MSFAIKLSEQKKNVFAITVIVEVKKKMFYM